MGKLSGEFRKPNRKDKVTRFPSVTYARQLGLLVNTLGSHLKPYNYSICRVVAKIQYAYLAINEFGFRRIRRIKQIEEGVIHRGRVDNTLRDLLNSSYPTKAEFINCFIIHSK